LDNLKEAGYFRKVYFHSLNQPHRWCYC